jgi:hypothetical protein
MDQQIREQAFITALSTEHFVLQGARSANVGEMTGRAMVHMGAVSSALIAFGFLAQVAGRVEPFIAAATVGLQASPLQMLFTGASVVAAINSILGGAGLALLAARLGHLGDVAAAVAGVAAAGVVFGLHLIYQQRRSTQLRQRL